MIPELESKPGLLESELESGHMMLESESKFFGKDWNRNQNRSHQLLESELASESWILVTPGIGIRIGISPSGIRVGIEIIKICSS